MPQYLPQDIPAKLAQDALFVQDACNLSGVVHAMSRAVTALRELPGASQGTEWVNRHPVMVLYADKIASLTGSGSLSTYGTAYTLCSDACAMEAL